MNGIVGFENHRINCIIGVHPEERTHSQDILIDLKIETNFSMITAEDNLTNAICYATLAEECTQVAQKGRYHMLETLAYELIKHLKKKFHLPWIWISIKKPSAVPSASFAFVELEEGKRGQ